MENRLDVRNRAEFRAWLTLHADTASECFVQLRRGRPSNDTQLWYLDAVEEALCFGWIDSTLKNIDGAAWNRFSPRKKGSPWTELNRARVRRLEKLGLMTDAGRAAVPSTPFSPDKSVVADVKAAGAWEQFSAMPTLYRNIRLYNLAFTKKRSSEQYEKALKHFLEKTLRGELYGEWNDYGRLTE